MFVLQFFTSQSCLLFMCLCLSLNLSASMFVRLSVRLFVWLCLSFCLSLEFSYIVVLSLFVYLYYSLSKCLFVCLFVCLSVCLFFCLSVCLSFCLFVCLLSPEYKTFTTSQSCPLYTICLSVCVPVFQSVFVTYVVVLSSLALLQVVLLGLEPHDDLPQLLRLADQRLRVHTSNKTIFNNRPLQSIA